MRAAKGLEGLPRMSEGLIEVVPMMFHALCRLSYLHQMTRIAIADRKMSSFTTEPYIPLRFTLMAPLPRVSGEEGGNKCTIHLW